MLNEKRDSTLGYVYECVCVMVTNREENKTEIINDLRAIKNVTVISIIKGQNFKNQRSDSRELTYIKVKYEPKGSPAREILNIKQRAYGSDASSCNHQKIDGLIEFIILPKTIKPIKTYE